MLGLSAQRSSSVTGAPRAATAPILIDPTPRALLPPREERRPHWRRRRQRHRSNVRGPWHHSHPFSFPFLLRATSLSPPSESRDPPSDVSSQLRSDSVMRGCGYSQVALFQRVHVVISTVILPYCAVQTDAVFIVARLFQNC